MPYPAYLFDVDYPDIADGVFRREGDGLVVEVDRALTDIVHGTSLGGVVDGLRSGRLAPVNVYMNSDMLTAIQHPSTIARAKIEQAGVDVVHRASKLVATAAEAWNDSQPIDMVEHASINFDPDDPEFTDRLATSGSEYWSIMSSMSIKAIKYQIEQSYSEGRNGAQMADDIELAAGLDMRRLATLRAQRSIMQSEGVLSPAEQRKALKRTADALKRSRAKNIAITELDRSINAGIMAYWNQMISRGALERFGTMVEWVTSKSETMCPTCGALDGQQVMLGTEFLIGIHQPPVHPNCKCSVRLVSNVVEGL